MLGFTVVTLHRQGETYGARHITNFRAHPFYLTQIILEVSRKCINREPQGHVYIQHILNNLQNEKKHLGKVNA